MDGISSYLRAALNEFLKDKDFHTEIVEFTLSKPKEKSNIEHQLRFGGARDLDCGWNDQGQWVCKKPS